MLHPFSLLSAIQVVCVQFNAESWKLIPFVQDKGGVGCVFEISRAGKAWPNLSLN